MNAPSPKLPEPPPFTGVRYPKVAIVTGCGPDAPEDIAAMIKAIATQNYPALEVLLLESPEIVSTDFSNSPVPVTVLSDSALKNVCRTKKIDFALVWTPGFQAHSTAVEKLVWTLTAHPEFALVKDSGTGAGTPFLLRVDSNAGRYLSRAARQKREWISEAIAEKIRGVSINEELFLPPGHVSAPEHTESVASLFPKAGYAFRNLEPISEEPPFPLTTTDTTPDPKHILLLVSSLPLGGACKFSLDLIDSLTQRGYRFTLATTHDYPNPWLGEFLQVTSDIFLLPHYLRAVDIPRYLLHLIRSRGIGRVVITHSLLPYHLLSFLRMHAPGVSFVDYTHIEFETEWPCGGYAQLSVDLQSQLDLSIVSSRHLREWMFEHGGNGDQIRVCHTNIDSEKWKPDPAVRERIRKELAIPEGTAAILYACRLADQKRPELMSQIIRELHGVTRAPFVLIVAGDGIHFEAMKKFFSREGITDCVRLLGAVKLEKVAQLHCASDIFFLPSQLEGISLALFEAMATENVPVVADVGGQNELITPSTGYLVKQGPREAAEYIQILQELVENPKKLREMAACARAHVARNFTLEQMADTMEACLDEADRRRVEQPVTLPDPHFCRGAATFAIDHLRLFYQSNQIITVHQEFRDMLVLKDKMITRLQDKLRQVQRQPVVT